MRLIYSIYLIILYFILVNISTTSRSEELDHLNQRTGLDEQNRHKTALSNGTEINLIYNGKCSEYGTCEHNANKGKPVCYCDESCQLFGDCCHDAYIKRDYQHLETNFDKQNLECSDKFDFVRDTGFGIYMISRCPNTYNSLEVSKKCSNESYDFPVTSNIGITYSNVYCAFCHNVTDYHAWTLRYFATGENCKLIVSESLTVKDKIKQILQNKCESLRPEQHIFLRFCIKHYRYGSNGTMANETICLKFNNPVVVIRAFEYPKIPIATYSNLFCYEDTIPDTDIMTSCLKPTPYKIGKFSSHGTMTGIFNIRPVIELFGQKLCKSDETFNNIHDVCLPKNCEDLDDDGKCILERIQNYIWEFTATITFLATSINDISPEICLRSLYVFHMSLPREKYGLSLSFIQGTFSCNNPNVSQSKCCIFDGKAIFKFLEALTITEINYFISKVKEIEWSYEELAMNESVIASTLNENKHGSKICSRSNVSSKKIGFDVGFYDNQHNFRFELNRSKTKIPESFNVTIDVDERLIGSYFGFTVRKFNIVYNLTVTDKYNITPSIIFPLESILSYITIGISEISLLVTMIIYGISGLSVSPSGAVSVNMMANMFVAQALYVVGAGVYYIKELCLAIGIVTHYTWLCAFSWCTIFLVNVVHTMRRLHTQPGRAPQQTKLSKITFCIGYGLPLTIVIPSALFDIFSIFHIHYVGKVCFPTGFPANLIVFTLPVLFCIIINIIVLTVTIVIISKFNNTTKSTESIINLRSYIPVYIKLGLISACPFLIGIIADFVDSDPLRYIYIVLAGLQGMFISLCFLQPQSVRTKIRQKIL